MANCAPLRDGFADQFCIVVVTREMVHCRIFLPMEEWGMGGHASLTSSIIFKIKLVYKQAWVPGGR